MLYNAEEIEVIICSTFHRNLMHELENLGLSQRRGETENRLLAFFNEFIYST